jgi:hypothetical protein
MDCKPLFKNLSVLSWNTQGLGDEDKCALVLTATSDAAPTIACIQETNKISSLETRKLRSFLPPHLSGFSKRDTDGSRGGVVTAWDPSVFSLSSPSHGNFSLTTILSSTTTDLAITITNVYAPSDHSLTPSFVAKMMNLLPSIPGPWLFCGEFNLIRLPDEPQV